MIPRGEYTKQDVFNNLLREVTGRLAQGLRPFKAFSGAEWATQLDAREKPEVFEALMAEINRRAEQKRIENKHRAVPVGKERACPLFD